VRETFAGIAIQSGAYGLDGTRRREKEVRVMAGEKKRQSGIGGREQSNARRSTRSAGVIGQLIHCWP
jgi:hypothetical protein